jgi:hypothetical protein
MDLNALRAWAESVSPLSASEKLLLRMVQHIVVNDFKDPYGNNMKQLEAFQLARLYLMSRGVDSSAVTPKK